MTLKKKTIGKIRSKIAEAFTTKDELDSALLLKAEEEDIPVTISELTNDTQFIHTDDVSEVKDVLNNLTTSFDNNKGVLKIYSTEYTLEVEHSSIETVLGDATINATLKIGEQGASGKTINLYNGDVLVASETTDNTGNVSFDVVVNETTLYTVKYKGLSKTVNVIFTPVITLNLESSEIITSDGVATINATLLINNNPYSQQNIQLYNGTTLVGTETTDNDGDVSFTVNVSLDTTIFTLKYGNDITATCTILYSQNTFPLDGTDGLHNKRGANYTGNGELTVVDSGQCWLTDYYLDNTNLWKVSYDYYQYGGNWQLKFLMTDQTSNEYGIDYTYQGRIGIGRINNSYSRYDLGSDFVYQDDRWVHVDIEKISSDTLKITIDNDVTTTVTDSKIAVPSAFYFAPWSASGRSVKIRNIILDPATPNE